MKKVRPHRHVRQGIRLLLRAKQNGKCCYCERPMRIWEAKTPRGGLPKDAETLEHLCRQADGGKHNADNLALSCHECNVGRGALDWLTYKTLKSGDFEVFA